MNRITKHLDAMRALIEAADAGQDRTEVVTTMRGHMISIATHLMGSQPAGFQNADKAISEAVDAYARAPTAATLAVLGCSFLTYRRAAEGEGEKAGVA